jgi:hypothetical protein
VFVVVVLLGVIVPEDEGITELLGILLPVMKVVLLPSNLAFTPVSINFIDFPNENLSFSPTAFCPTI